LIQLTQVQWARLYKEVLVIANRMTFTRSSKHEYSARDRAQEGLHRACMRLFEVKPSGLDTIDALRRYLVGATRSELGHASDRAAFRKATEGAAATDDATVGGGSAPSAEKQNLDAAQRDAEQVDAARAVRMLKRKLTKANDTMVLETMKLIARDVVSPEAQAKALGCDVEEIYNARKRRNRAMDEVVAAIRAGKDDEDEEKT
jgi:hypothetical protein